MERNTTIGRIYTSKELYEIAVEHGYRKPFKSFLWKLRSFENILFRRIKLRDYYLYKRIEYHNVRKNNLSHVQICGLTKNEQARRGVMP